MDRKKQILNAIKNQEFDEIEILTTDENIVLEIIDEYLENDDFSSCIYLKNQFRFREPDEMLMVTSREELTATGQMEWNKRVKVKQINKPIKTKIGSKFLDKLIHLIETNKIELFHDFFQELYKPEKDYKDYIGFSDDIIMQSIVNNLIEKDDIDLLFEIFSYLNDNYTFDYDETIEIIFLYFFKNKEREFYSKFRKSFKTWFNELLEDSIFDFFYDYDFFYTLIKNDTDLALIVIQLFLKQHFNRCDISNEFTKEHDNLLFELLSTIDFFKVSMNEINKNKITKILSTIAKEYENKASQSLFLIYYIIQEENDKNRIFEQIISKEFKDDIINIICDNYLNPRSIIIEFKERRKIVDFLLDQNLDFDSELKILEAFISNQTSVTLQKDIFNLSEYIIMFSQYFTDGIKQENIQEYKKINKDVKYLLAILVSLYDSNCNFEDENVLISLSGYFFNSKLNKDNFSQSFSFLELSWKEFEKTGISKSNTYTDNDYIEYENQIKTEYFAFMIFHRIFNKIDDLSRQNEFKTYFGIMNSIYIDLLSYSKRIRIINSAVEKEDEKTEARLEERNRIMANLSHTVKNMIGTIIDPLENMKSSNELQPVAIDNAIRGANLVRSLVNAMNLSFKGSIDDFQYDIQNAGYKDATSIKQLFIESLKYSISSMFDGKYFNKFMRNYFPNKPAFIEAKSKWNGVSQSIDLGKIESFMEEFMLKSEIKIETAKDYVIGNDKGSSLKLLILIQEMVFNAVKYSSFVPQPARSLKIEFDANEEYVSIRVSNKFKPNVEVKSTGLGQEIINNFSKLLKTKPVVKTDDEAYSVEVKFENLWED